MQLYLHQKESNLTSNLLQSLGEAAPQAQAQEDKKQKQKRASKDKREKKRRGGDKTASTSAAGNHHKEIGDIFAVNKKAIWLI